MIRSTPGLFPTRFQAVDCFVNLHGICHLRVDIKHVCIVYFLGPITASDTDDL
jgi:hypothetical protein